MRRALRSASTVSLTPADSPGEIHWLQIDSPPPQVGGADEAAHFDQLPVSGNDKSSSEIVKTRNGTLDDPVSGGTPHPIPRRASQGIYNRFRIETSTLSA
jgi:hypothetical protein